MMLTFDILLINGWIDGWMEDSARLIFLGTVYFIVSDDDDDWITK